MRAAAIRLPRGALGRAPLALVVGTLLLHQPSGVRGQTTEGLGVPAPERAPAEIQADKLDKPPKQIKFVEAEYPPVAAEQGIEAEVVLIIDINAEGKVDGVSIEVPADPPGMGFDEAAMVAANQFEFEPAELDGQPIAVQIAYRYRFQLKPQEPEPPPAPADPSAPAAAPADPGAPPTAPAEPPRPARAPVINFSGTLLERGTRLPLAGVLVTVFQDVPPPASDDLAWQVPPAGAAPAKPPAPEPPPAFEATADASGKFAFYDLQPGTWKVVVEAPGYYPFRTTETIAPGEAVTVTYYVERGSYNPFDITVTATRPRKEVNRTILSIEEIEKVPGTFGDPLAVIQNFAGVARTPNPALLVVRGSAPEDTRVFVDGAEVPLIYHFGGLRSVIPAGMLESIEFYPGNFSPAYGRATGGIVDVRINQLKPQKVGGYADVSLLDTSLYLEVPVSDKGAFALAGRRSYIDFLINALVPENAGVNVVTAPRYYDFQLLGNYRPSAAHDLRAFFFASDDRLKFLFQNPADIDTNFQGNSISASTSFYRSLFTYRYVPGGRWENELRFSQGRNWFKLNAGQFIFDIDLYTAQLRDTARFKLAEPLTLVVGADTTFSTADFLVQLPRPPQEGEPMGNFDISQLMRSGGTETLYHPAGYLELEWQPLPGLLLLPGLRVDFFDRTNETVFQPRFTGRWDLTDWFTVKGGAGLFAQEPNFQQGETDPEFGNPALEGERAWHYSFGVEYKPWSHVTLDATAFYKDLDRLVSRTDQIQMVDGQVRPLIYDNAGRGRVYGLEFVARHTFENDFTGWVAYTLSRSLRTDSGDTEERLFDFDQTHILTLVGSYLLPRNWQIGGRFRLVSGNPRTPVVGSVYNADDDVYDPVFGEVNSARNAPFHQLDLRVDKRWIYQKWMLSVYLDIQNVYNRANPEGLQYNFDYSQSRPQQGLPILPILGIRGEF